MMKDQPPEMRWPWSSLLSEAISPAAVEGKAQPRHTTSSKVHFLKHSIRESTKWELPKMKMTLQKLILATALTALEISSRYNNRKGAVRESGIRNIKRRRRTREAMTAVRGLVISRASFRGCLACQRAIR